MNKRWWIIPLAVIVIVAAYLRLYKISGYMTFLGDEGRDVLVVMRMIVNHKFTLLGPTASVGGFFLGPIYYYFMLPFLWAWKLSPVGPAVMVALFGVSTVYLVYKVGREFVHPVVGFIAASLYALSPLVIAYSRSSWNPNLVPFFSLLLMYLLWLAVEKKRTSTLLWIGFILGIGLQLHYLFIFLFVVTAFWFILQAKTISPVRSFLLVGAGFLVGYSPFLVFELRHNFPNTQSVVRFVLAGKDTGISPGFFSTVDDVVFRLFGRLLYRLPDGGVWKSLPAWQLASWFIGTRTTIFVSFMFLVILVSSSIRSLACCRSAGTRADRAWSAREDHVHFAAELPRADVPCQLPAQFDVIAHTHDPAQVHRAVQIDGCNERERFAVLEYLRHALLNGPLRGRVQIEADRQQRQRLVVEHQPCPLGFP